MAIRVLMRGGIYILFIAAAAAGWLIKRRQRSNPPQTRPVVSSSLTEPVNALQDARWQIRLEAVRKLGQQAGQDDLPMLVVMLNDSDSDVRDATIEALAAYGTKATQPLMDTLSRGGLISREAAARAIGSIADPEAVPALIAALRDESEWVRIQAAKALAEILKTEIDPAVRQTIGEALSPNEKP